MMKKIFRFIWFLIFNFANTVFSYPCSIKHLRSPDKKSIFLISDYHISYDKVKEVDPKVRLTKFRNCKILGCEKTFLRSLTKLNTISNNEITLFWESSENIHKYFIKNSIFNTFLQFPLLKLFVNGLNKINLNYVDTWRGLFNYYSNLPDDYKSFIRCIEKLCSDILPNHEKYIENLDNINIKHKYYMLWTLRNFRNRLKDFYDKNIEPNKNSEFCEFILFPPKSIEYKDFWSEFNKLFIIDMADYKMLLDLLLTNSKISILYAGAMHCHMIENVLRKLDFELISEKYRDENLNKTLVNFYKILEGNYALLDGIATQDQMKYFSDIKLIGPKPLSSSDFKVIFNNL
ncbi:hypothetical protein [Candidatus Babela massiliensis]|uniref:Uncharacterized protein n=1 Tax=Candidatus Babela massiliensis TaxID=673862 RepID=V6DGU0_9BACT|nr:hypothetical protein [Candidatus Babela massiliensis]CDK30143.1 hypothetical protein BABL1_gene_837 [Candidatus Babela massiliensis]